MTVAVTSLPIVSPHVVPTSSIFVVIQLGPLPLLFPIKFPMTLNFISLTSFLLCVVPLGLIDGNVLFGCDHILSILLFLEVLLGLGIVFWSVIARPSCNYRGCSDRMFVVRNLQ